MRISWNGSISFGLVNIPVGLAAATKPVARASDVSFRMLHRECQTPIKQKRWCPTHDREVGPDEIVKGWEVAKGEFVLVEDADLEAIAQLDTSKAIEITSFVPLEEIDPVYFDRTYYLVPSTTAVQRRPYVLLLRAMQETGTAGVGRFIRQGQEHVCLVRAMGGALALETLFLAEDVASHAEIDESIEDVDVKGAELDLARQVIASMAAEFEAAELVSEYRGNLRTMLEAKLEGREIASPEPAVETPVVDLMEALRRSVADAKQRKPGDGAKAKAKAASKSGARTRRAPARKSA